MTSQLIPGYPEFLNKQYLAAIALKIILALLMSLLLSGVNFNPAIPISD